MISSPASAAINHLLAQESWARNELMRHAGKTAVFDAGLATLRLKVAGDGMVQPAGADEPVHVTIRVKLADVPMILQHRDRAFSYVQIEGDADFANTISRLSENLRWEAEDDLARLIGDIPATRLVATARSVGATAAATQRKLAENVAEYLVEERAVLVRPQQVAEFGADVTRLRDDLERLSKRVERLAAGTASGGGSR
ncbi:ubiquinone biosynthesis accessory factor UbiJ [Noviherbaspirillum galbum]|uniref:Ubiquinone biosynthesis accessory factor UbiJ n=1 Tax=Noviherbaspirillum galbum TaxID=2709383 RepID=A0A6B3SYC8_9BURK|nr:SCP2 sterol-binding domain-containing protein [Noviherbaspirillum galbum]NEX64356.1 sterol-binding protein [Noviherbaspirillum galbum]